MDLFCGWFRAAWVETLKFNGAEVERHARDPVEQKRRCRQAATHPIRPKGGCKFFRKYSFPPDQLAWQAVQGQLS